VVPEGKSGNFLSYKEILAFDIMRSTDFLIFPPSNLDFFWLVNFYFGFELPLCDLDLILFSPLLVVLEMKFHLCVCGELRNRWFSFVGSKYMFTNKQFIKIKIKINSSNGVMEFGFSVNSFCFLWFDGTDEDMLTEGVLRLFELFPVSRCGVMDSGFALVDWLWCYGVMEFGFSVDLFCFLWFDGTDEKMLAEGVLRLFELFPVSRCGVMDSGFASVIVQGHGRMLVGLRVMDSNVRTE